MNRFITFTALCFTSFLMSCAGPAPAPEPGLEVLQHGRGHEMQVATDVDWNSYTKIILHEAPVEFVGVVLVGVVHAASARAVLVEWRPMWR